MEDEELQLQEDIVNYKHIFIIWFQGFDNMPEICKACYYSWKNKNPDWKIHFIDNSNLNEYIDHETISKFKKIEPIQCFSDAVRLQLIYRYGGLYVDATIYCNKPLDEWLNNNLIENTFVQWDFDSSLPSINFLYSKKIKNTYFYINIELNKLNNSYHKINNLFYKNINVLRTNFIKKQNKLIGKSSNNTKVKQGVKIIANSFKLMNQQNDNNFKNALIKYPYFKLTYKNVPSGELRNVFDQNSKFITLINHYYKNLHFIHIGKCGGTTINGFGKNLFPEYHQKRNYKNNENYFIWLRNPITRFVSAFYMSYNLVNLNIKNLDINNLTLDNCLAPCKVKKKIKNNGNVTFTKRYDYLINYFKTANELAESITSENIEKKRMSLELMNSTIEHIFKGIGWYLYNGDFIEKNHHKIIFVGTIENIQEDSIKLSKLLNIEFDTTKNLRKNFNNNDKYLSPKAIQNIINFYKDTDYKALQKLVDYNFITKELFEEYHQYNI